MNLFENQVAVVTGGTRGIGRGVTETLLEQGATVVALYGGDDAAARAFIAGNGSERLSAEKVDVSDYAAVERFFDLFAEKHERLDILVNNAGIRRDAVVGMMSDENWRSVIDINLTGTFNCSKFAVQAMMKRKYGRIINMTSPIGVFGFAGQANYAASKAGQVALTKSLSKEVASRKITVNCVSPGFIDTDFIGDLPDEQVAAYKKMVPARRFGMVSEVARCVSFLASPESAYINGAVLEITGGL